MKCHASAGALYSLGFIGALVYFIQHSTSFMEGVWGFVLAAFWPGVLVYKVLELLKF